jgi:hypothetical protein
MYNYYSDGSASYREGIRNGVYVVDKVVTSTGFAGVINTDWINIYSAN